MHSSSVTLATACILCKKSFLYKTSDPWRMTYHQDTMNATRRIIRSILIVSGEEAERANRSITSPSVQNRKEKKRNEKKGKTSGKITGYRESSSAISGDVRRDPVNHHGCSVEVPELAGTSSLGKRLGQGGRRVNGGRLLGRCRPTCQRRT